MGRRPSRKFKLNNFAKIQIPEFYEIWKITCSFRSWALRVQTLKWMRQYSLDARPPSVLWRHGYMLMYQNYSLNTLRPRQIGRQFCDGNFKCIFLNENMNILIKISLKFVPNGSIYNIPALVQVMAWCRSGDKPLSEPMMPSLLTHICVTRRHTSFSTTYPSTMQQTCFHYIHCIVLHCNFHINNTMYLGCIHIIEAMFSSWYEVSRSQIYAGHIF